MSQIAEKTCKHCCKVKPLFKFSRSKSYKDGRVGVCADCRNAKRRAAAEVAAHPATFILAVRKCESCFITRPATSYIAGSPVCVKCKKEGDQNDLG